MYPIAYLKAFVIFPNISPISVLSEFADDNNVYLNMIILAPNVESAMTIGDNVGIAVGSSVVYIIVGMVVGISVGDIVVAFVGAIVGNCNFWQTEINLDTPMIKRHLFQYTLIIPPYNASLVAMSSFHHLYQHLNTNHEMTQPRKYLHC